jgi:hypothetical protein
MISKAIYVLLLIFACSLDAKKQQKDGRLRKIVYVFNFFKGLTKIKYFLFFQFPYLM